MTTLTRLLAALRGGAAGLAVAATRSRSVRSALVPLALLVLLAPVLVIVAVVSVFSHQAQTIINACNGGPVDLEPGYTTMLGPGWTVQGPVSTFGPPNEPPARTAYGRSSAEPGIALNPQGGAAWNGALARSLAGKWFSVHVAGHRAALQVIDKGPFAAGPNGWRLIDVTGAGAIRLGLNPHTFPTDSPAQAVMLAGPPQGTIDQGTGAGGLLGLTPVDQLAPAAGATGGGLDCSQLSVDVETPVPLVPGHRARLLPNGKAAAPKDAPAEVQAMIAAGNRIAGRPYQYGGGHGMPLDRLSATYDCSSSVEYLLHAAGLIPATWTPASTALMSYGMAGVGQWVTIAASPAHVYMYVAGLRWDTHDITPADGDRSIGWHTEVRDGVGFTTRHPGGL